MQSASIPQTLIDVRPVVRNMRPDGYVLQTGGSATRKVIEMEGNQARPLFRVTGVPLHTHNTSALLQVEAKNIFPVATNATLISHAGEFSEEKIEIRAGDYVDHSALPREEIEARFKRAIEWGIGRIDLQPENSRNKISEPTRAISEIRTLVCPREIRESSTFIEEKFTLTDREGNGLLTTFPEIVHVPVLPTNNGHVESQFAGALSPYDDDLRLEIWPEVGDQQAIRLKGGIDYNDWDIYEHSWTTLLDDQQVPAPLAYPVAVVAIGMNKPVQVRDGTTWKDWDGRVPYRYSAERDVYVFDGPVQIRFQSDVFFGSDGTNKPMVQADEKRVLRNWFDPSKEVDGTTDAAEVGGLVFEIQELPTAQRSADGFFYLNGDAGGTEHITENVAPHRERYAYPRLAVTGKFLLREVKVEYDGGPVAVKYTSQVRRVIRNAADSADLLQDPVFATRFQGVMCAWFAPMVRWEVGSRVPVSGPLLRPINFAIDRADASKHHTLFADPATPTLLAWSSATQAVAARTLEHSKKLTITDGNALEQLLDIKPNPASLYQEEGDAPGGNLEDLATTKTLVNAGSHAVPFRAGLYPFPQDFRFRHFAGDSAVFDLASDPEQADFDGALAKGMYVPPGAPEDERFVNRSGTVEFQWPVEADHATNGSDTDKTLKEMGFVGDSRESVFANIRPNPRPTDYTNRGVERARTHLIIDGRYGTGQVAAVLPFCSEFLLSPSANTIICPCMYVSDAPELTLKNLTADGQLQFDVNNVTSYASLAIPIDQEPFYRVAFNRGLLRYRGGYCFNTDEEFDSVQGPTVGNVFHFGGDDLAAGGIGNVVDGVDNPVEMSVQVLASGSLRVKGLAFHPRLRKRTLLFYYGGAQGDAESVKKQLYISDPTARRTTTFDPATAVGDGSERVQQQCWTTNIPVRSFDPIVGTAAVDIDSANEYTHLYMAVIAPRSQGLFTVEGHGALHDFIEASKGRGIINAPSYVITQSIQAPVLNSDFRGECVEPLNQMTAFLPPEMRDFNLVLRDMDWRHMGPTLETNVKRMIFSEFNGGNQQVAAVPSLLSVPEFRLYTAVVQAGDTAFDIELFTPMGPPSFWAVYARSDESPNYGTQPLIVQLYMSCLTTGKKSDSIDGTELAELYFLTQRNVHRKALYEHNAFNKRQVVLLRSEDVGTMGLNPALYQREKRTRYRVKGTIRELDVSATVTVMLVYNNRGLQVQGKEISVQYL